jgi:SAM-dependent methyltransferase
MLDFDAALADGAQPPLPEPDDSIEEIRAPTAFTHLVGDWAEWLLELRRVLRRDGRLVVGLAPRERFEQLTGSDWEDTRIGMTVVSALDGPGRREVFHSEWWLRAHWGRAFEFASVHEGDAQRQVVLAKRSGDLSSDELELPEPGEERELEAARANTALLGDQLDRARRQLEEQRENMSRELMRRSFAAADAEWARGGPGSPATAVAAEYEATTSWRLTKPLRAMGRLLKRDR